MAAMYRTCIGGPSDGRVASGRALAVAWIDNFGRAHEFPGTGRAPYLLDGGYWRFAGHGFRRCSGCGAFVAPDADGWALDPCPLCGLGDG
jgi:hypothetical protein